MADPKMHYYTADNPVTGEPYAAFRTATGWPIEIWDPARRDWVSAGWPVKFLAGGDNNYSDVPADKLADVLEQLACEG